MTIAYFFVMITALLFYGQIFFFWYNTKSWYGREFERTQQAFFHKMQRNCVMVRGIPKSIEPQIASRDLYVIYKKLL